MINYKHIIDIDGKSILDNAIQKLPNMSIIPFDPDNTDYQAYLAWLAEGNVPEPAEE
jgi:hypothetical protein